MFLYSKARATKGGGARDSAPLEAFEREVASPSIPLSPFTLGGYDLRKTQLKVALS